MKAVILHTAMVGNDSPDNLDTMVQVEAISEALKRHGYSIALLPFDVNLGVLQAHLRGLKPDLVVNLVEAVNERDSLAFLAAFYLEQLGVPHTGCASRAIYLTSDKIVTKQMLKAEGIATPDWLPRRALEGLASAGNNRAELACPFIVKSVSEDCSRGLESDSVQMEPTPHSLLEAIVAQEKRFGGEWFAEQYVEGREFNVGLFERSSGEVIVLPCSEIEFVNYPKGKPRIVCYKAKWHEDSEECQNTRRKLEFGVHEEPLLERLRNIARVCWNTFSLGGYARVDFRVPITGDPYVLEINANPCLSPDAGFFAAAQRAGFSYDDMVLGLVNVARRGPIGAHG